MKSDTKSVIHSPFKLKYRKMSETQLFYLLDRRSESNIKLTLVLSITISEVKHQSE